MLITPFESLLKTYFNYSVMQQFGTSAFNTVVHWRELGEVENECTSYNFRQFAFKFGTRLCMENDKQARKNSP